MYFNYKASFHSVALFTVSDWMRLVSINLVEVALKSDFSLNRI